MAYDKMLLVPQESSGHDLGDGSFFLDSGGVYLRGNWPLVRTTRVSAGADGVRIAAKLEPAADIQKFFLLTGAEARIVVDEQEQKLCDPNKYMELPQIGPLVEKKLDDPANAADKAFVEQVKQAAIAQGLW